MIPPLSPAFFRREQRGIAIILVVLMLGMMTLLVVALFTVSDAELKGAKHFSNHQEARQLADTAVNVVISQLRQGSTQDKSSSSHQVWTTQPGMIRKYGTDGQLASAYKLYSSSQMVLTGAGLQPSSLLNDVPPQDWENHPERYVDLNRPIYRTNSSSKTVLLFPVIDPRAMTGDQNSVSGFSYSAKYANGSTIDQVITTPGDGQRLPMPVEWLYVLKDGSLGVLDSNNTFVGGETPTTQNPIVGRVAFWTDDESCKVNINTAAETTPWSLPTFYNQEDQQWAQYQPVNGEVQRYPGHPFTTALSPILFPAMMPLSNTDKELLYGLAPKIGPGGSKEGTVAYNDPSIASIALSQYRSKHLYASLDEYLLKPDRSAVNFGDLPVTPQSLQQKSFFLTAHSKAPEINPFGLPKIAMWPISYRGSGYTTAYDNLIAFCSTLKSPTGKTLYMFQRGYSDSTTADINYTANQTLLNYLLTLLKKPIPGFASSGSATYSNKYDSDLPQIVTEIFDYIRSTNLYDSALAGDPITPSNTTSNVLYGYDGSFTRPTDYKTFTDPRFAQTGTDETGASVTNQYRGFPGHGQVTPSSWTYNGTTYQGFGRFFTISQVGMHFICCADNTNDPNNPFPSITANNLGKPGGGSAPKLVSTDNNVQDRWYSNFPPNPTPNPYKGDKANLALYPLTQGYPYGSSTTHPGYNPLNWNWQLNNNTPLPMGTRRIMGRILLEYFFPQDGYTIIEPEFTVVVSGLSNLTLNGQRLFPNDQETVRSGRKALHAGCTQTGGWSIGVKGNMRDRETPARAPMPADTNWGNANWQVKPSASASSSLSILDYDLVSNFIDVPVNMDGSGSMHFAANGPITIQVYSNHLGKTVSSPEIGAMLVQTLNVQFPQEPSVPALPVPSLVRNPIPAITNATTGAVTTAGVECPYWWTFYGKGCMNFSYTVKQLPATLAQAKAAATPASGYALEGRIHNTSAAAQSGGTPRVGAFFYGFDDVVPGATPGVAPIFKPQQGVTVKTLDDILAADIAQGCDVVQSMIIPHGDYRLTAALATVKTTQWAPHRNWGLRPLAHMFSNDTANTMPGYDYGTKADLALRLVSNTTSNYYPQARIPSIPYSSATSKQTQLYGDFDNGFGPERDGPYINKSDEGSLGDTSGNLAYFANVNTASAPSVNFFTPNRQIPSPVILGSLPTGVQSQVPWRTLEFRAQQGHFGGPSKLGGADPADHLLLEFFWMPVVEPYAISEAFTTAGKVNMNYQILPFTNITRNSALYGVMQNTLIHAVGVPDINKYKNTSSTYYSSSDGYNWHLPIDVAKTLAQFDQRFASGAGFLSASEICDLYLVPQGYDSAQMETFWSNHKLTGDNTREAPYAALYPRLTTRSNTFRVHFIAQSIQKARSTPANTMQPADTVTSEYRGSTLVERYLDPAQSDLPDFTSSTTTTSLDDYNRYRILESKKFGS